MRSEEATEACYVWGDLLLFSASFVMSGLALEKRRLTGVEKVFFFSFGAADSDFLAVPRGNKNPVLLNGLGGA